MHVFILVYPRYSYIEEWTQFFPKGQQTSQHCSCYILGFCKQIKYYFWNKRINELNSWLHTGPRNKNTKGRRGAQKRSRWSTCGHPSRSQPQSPVLHMCHTTVLPKCLNTNWGGEKEPELQAEFTKLGKLKLLPIASVSWSNCSPSVYHECIPGTEGTREGKGQYWLGVNK